MRKKVFGLMIVFLLLGANLYAADGDLIVNGKLGIGTTSPNGSLDIFKTQSGETQLWLENRNTTAANTQTALVFGGYRDVSNPWPLAKIQVQALTSNAGELAQNGEMRFYTGGLNYGGLFQRMVIRADGYVGIGTTVMTDFAKLQIDDVAVPLSFRETDQSGAGSLWRMPLDAKILRFDVSLNGTDFSSYKVPLAMTNEGYVGIGTTSPSYQLQLSTNLAAKTSTNTWIIASDSRLKTDIQPYTKGLKEILQINPVSYKYNGKGGIGHNKVKGKNPITGEDTETEIVDTELLSQTNVGVIAEDIQSVVPETVSSHKGKINDDDADETEILDFNSHSLTFILINAVKDLKAQIDSLEEQIADLKAMVK